MPPDEVRRVGLEWLDMANAPRTGKEILILLGETIPDNANVRSASFLDGDGALELGYREFSRFGAWLIWNDADDWYCVDETGPLGWLPLPEKMPRRHRVIDGDRSRTILQQKEPE